MTEPYKPEWAKRLEEWGKEMEAKYGRHSDHAHSHPHETVSEDDSSQQASNGKDHCTHHGHRHSKDGRPYWQRQNNPVGDMFGQLISYLIFTYVPGYFPGFFLNGWSAVYTVLVFSILVHVAVDIVTLLIQVKPMFYLGRVITNIAGIIATVTMVTIFPFNFPGTLGHVVQFALWVAIVVTAVVTFFDFLKIFSPECCE